MRVKLNAAQEALAVHSCGTTGPLGCAFLNTCCLDITKKWRHVYTAPNSSYMAILDMQ